MASKEKIGFVCAALRASVAVTAETPGARRACRYRERQRRGVCVVPVEVTCEMVEALIKHGDLDEGVADDHNEIGKSIAAAAYRALQLQQNYRLINRRR